MEKSASYYSDLIVYVLEHEYSENADCAFAVECVKSDSWYGERLNDEIDEANTYAWGRCTVDEYEYARWFIVNDLVSLLDIELD